MLSSVFQGWGWGWMGALLCLFLPSPSQAGRSAQTRLFVSAGAREEAEAETMPGKLKVKIVAGRHLPVMDRASDLTDAFVEVGARSCPSKHRERQAL